MSDPTKAPENTVAVDPGTDAWPEISPYSTGFRGLCPRCGKGKMFCGFLSLCRQCEVCGLDFSYADPADGPAFFSMMFFCLPPTGLGVWLEVSHGVSYLTNAMITLPVLLICIIAPLRPLKGWLVASQYYYKAEEGQRVRVNPDAPASGLKDR